MGRRSGGTSMSEHPRFLFVTCQVGAEKAVKGEVSRRWRDFSFAFSRPGFLTFKLPEDSSLLPDFDLRAIFARSYGFSLGGVRGGDADGMVAMFGRFSAIVRGIGFTSGSETRWRPASMASSRRRPPRRRPSTKPCGETAPAPSGCRRRPTTSSAPPIAAKRCSTASSWSPDNGGSAGIASSRSPRSGRAG